MTEQEPREINHQRIETAAGRFQRLILEGIAKAHEAGGEIDEGTARTIAHVLGRALGRESRLAEFGRTADGQYEELREEYLSLYNDPTTPPMIKEWIDWFGTYLVQTQAEGSGRRFMNEHLAPKLDQLLVRHTFEIGDWAVPARVPAALTGPEIEALGLRLVDVYDLTQEEALVAYLTLPDVDASADNLLDSFGENFVGSYASLNEAIRSLSEVDEVEQEIAEIGRAHNLMPAISIDLNVVEGLTREVYDVVELGGHAHAFHK